MSPRTSESDIQETWEGTARIAISRNVKGYQECRFSVDESLSSTRRLASGEERFKSLTLEGSSILFDWFKNRTHSEIDVRFCLIAEPSRTPIVLLSSIEFLFDFVRLDTPRTPRLQWFQYSI